MADENWQQVRKIFDDALRQKPEERARFVNEVCRSDKILLAEVESLLSSLGSAESFMETPAVANVADVIEAETRKLEKGKCFGHYEIIEQIGAGGMGEVYLARDQKLNRRVALKVLPANLSAETEANQRLLREAQAAATLDHPHICAIYEIAEANGYSFIVMQYVEGETLAEKLGKEKLSIQKSLDLAIQIADALAEAHAHHIIHRDIKPANIIVSGKGQAKVLDFGLAKFVRVESEDEKAQLLSKPGAIMGTVPYMSPEQVRGATLDARSDIFSFGAMLYEMLSGQQPFAQKNNAETISAILNDEPRWTEIPSKFQSIIKKSLQKNRDERYQKTEDLAGDLRHLQHSGAISNVTDSRFWNADTAALPQASTKDISPTTRQIKYWRSFRLPILAGLICVVVLAGFGYGLYRLTVADGKPVDSSRLKVTRLTSNGNAVSAAISPDGKFISYIIENEGQHSLWLKNVEARTELQIVPPAENTRLFGVTFSPDGNYIFYGANGNLYQLSILGDTPKKVLSNYGGFVSFSPDGKQFTYLRFLSEGGESAIIVIVNTDGTGERILASSKRPSIFLRSAVWSPDGKVIGCVALNTAGNQEVVTVRVADGAVLSVPSLPFDIIPQIAWRPDGSLLIISGDDGTFFPQIWSLSYPTGEARNITNDSNDYQSISLTADATSLIAVRAEQEAHLWVTPAEDASRAKQLTSGFEKFDGVWGINWTTDGKIIYEAAPSGKFEVWRIDADGRNLKQLSGEVGVMVTSPNGKYLVYQSHDDDGTGLFGFDWSNGEKKRLTTGADIWAAFSPDGRWIIFTRYADNVALWKVSIDGGEAIKLTNFPGLPTSPTVSPDGKFIAFHREKSGTMSHLPLAVIAFEGGEIIKEFDGPIGKFKGMGKSTLQWTPDGQSLDYAVTRNGVSNLWRQPLDGSPPVQITNFEAMQIYNFAASPDGKQFALSRGTFNRDVVLIKNFE